MDDKEYRIVADKTCQRLNIKRWRLLFIILIPVSIYSLYTIISRSETLDAEPELLIPVVVFFIIILIAALFVREDEVVYTIRLSENKLFICRKNATLWLAELNEIKDIHQEDNETNILLFKFKYKFLILRKERDSFSLPLEGFKFDNCTTDEFISDLKSCIKGKTGGGDK